MRLERFVNPVEFFGNVEVPYVLDRIGCRVVVVVAGFVVLAETVEMLHSKVQLLQSQKYRLMSENGKLRKTHGRFGVTSFEANDDESSQK